MALLAVALACACAKGGRRGAIDAGPSDAGPISGDAGRPDAGASDGGGDAGRADAGARSDAGRDAGAVLATCGGNASACSSRDVASCEGQLGCSAVQRCTGTPAPCSRHTDSFDCNWQLNCDWDSFGGNGCTDDGSPCTSFIGADACGFVEGCVYGPSCAGTPTPCEQLGVAACSGQDGCAPL